MPGLQCRGHSSAGVLSVSVVLLCCCRLHAATTCCRILQLVIASLPNGREGRLGQMKSQQRVSAPRFSSFQ